MWNPSFSVINRREKMARKLTHIIGKIKSPFNRTFSNELLISRAVSQKVRQKMSLKDEKKENNIIL